MVSEGEEEPTKKKQKKKLRLIAMILTNIVFYRFKPGPEVTKLFSCSTQLSMTFFLLINVKMPTIVGILTFMSQKNSILVLSEPKKS